MALPDSALYQACDALATALGNGIQANTHGIKIYLGAPADIASKKDEHRVNIFFYRFEPSGFQANAHPHDPWRIRLFCLVTCMGEDGDTQGEDDLRLLGLVMAFFHEQRIMSAVDINGETVRLQAVFRPSTDEQINQIWSTQGDTTFRPSVIYEIALAPILPSTLRGEPPRVGFTGLETVADFNRRYDPFAGNVRIPRIDAGSVTQANPAWAPLITWVADGECCSALALDVEAVDPATFKPTLWLAGKSGDSVQLEWQIWQDEEWITVAGPALVVSSNAIDPDNIPVGLPTVSLPALSITAGRSHWQVLLYATRSYQPYVGAQSIVLRSNPLSINLYRGSVV